MAREWLKQVRGEQHFTQASLARAAGIKVARYSRIEAGYCDLGDDEAQALAATLKQSVDFVRSGRRDLGLKTPEVKPTTPHLQPAAAAIPKSKTPSESPSTTPKGCLLYTSPSPRD